MNLKNTLLMAPLSLLMSAFTVQAGPAYTIIDVGTLGGTYAQATGINIHGNVVGFSPLPATVTVDGETLVRALLYNGILHDIGTPYNTPNAGFSYAQAINSSGVVVGGFYGRPIDSGFAHAFLFNGHMSDLGTLPSSYMGIVIPNDGYSSWATAINNLGEAVGWGQPGDDQFGYDEVNVYHALTFSGGKITDLGTLGSGVNSFAEGINNLGEIVGYSSYVYPASQWAQDLGPYHAFLYAYGHMYDLGINPVLAPYQSAATAINDHGQVVGYTSTVSPDLYPQAPTQWNGVHHAFLDNAGTFKDLGALGLYNSGQSKALAINNSGEIVGTNLSVLNPHAT